LEEILEVALADSEQWVSMLAEIMKTYPRTSLVHTEISEPEENQRMFLDLVEEVKKDFKQVKKLNLLPLECPFLNKSALVQSVGAQAQKVIVKHFNVKPGLKSAHLKADLLMRSNDAAMHSAKKIPAPTIPLRTRGMPRKMTDTTPLKGLPSQGPTTQRTVGIPPQISRNLARPLTEKKGGIKVLDINEQPIGFSQAKRRKKTQDLEDAKKAMVQGEDGMLQSSETPDYAMGLPSARGNTPPPPTPQLVPPPTPASYPPPPTPQVLLPPATPMSYMRQSSIPDGPPPTPKAHLPNNVNDNLSQGTAHQNAYLPVSISNPPAAPRKAPVSVVPTVQPQTKTVILQVPNHQPQQIMLSKDLMEKAQEIFRTANRATRPEKEHILKFMAGTRDNPCPELGSIVTIKLSEKEEAHRQNDGSIVALCVETHFQMNYNTGEWKVITKPPKLDQSLGQHLIHTQNI